MATAKMIKRFESEMAAVQAAVDAQNAKLTWMQWMLGIGFVVITVLIAVLGILSQTGYVACGKQDP